MESAAPTIHPVSSDAEASELVAELTDPGRKRVNAGIHVVVHVSAGGNTAYGRIVDKDSLGHGSQRWLKHARRGASPGGWTEEHHPRSEKELGAWRAEHAAALDQLLIDACKRAWKLDATGTYVVEFAPLPTLA